MSFLNPAVLFGLVAVAIPVLLHLLNLRKLRTVEFSTLAFLKELQKSQMRRLKLRQILLLILRTLVIASLVLAFARPALRGTAFGGIGTQAKTTVVLMLDDSFSMAAMEEKGSLINQAKASALEILTAIKEGDEVYFQKFSEGNPGNNSESPTHDLAAVRLAVEETRISMSRHSLGELLQRARAALRQSTNLNKEIYLVTDLQKTNFATESRQSFLKSSDSPQPAVDRGTRVFLVPVGAGTFSNVCVDSVELKSKILESSRPVLFQVRLQNYGTSDLRNYTSSLYFDGTRVMQRSVDLPAGAVINLDFSAVPKRGGYISGYVQTEPDVIDPDNVRYFTLFVPEKIAVLFVTESQADVAYLNLALTADERSKGSVSIETVHPSKLLMTALPRFDVLIVANTSSLTTAEAERLRQYVSTGGGMILFPGDKVQLDNYNEVFCRAFQLSPFSLKSVGELKGGSFLSFESADLKHPLFSGMFDEKVSGRRGTRRALESPEIHSTLEHLPGRSGRSIIKLSDGTSFLTEYTIGLGKLLVFTVPATPTWSNFPLKGLFAPLVRRSVAYLAAPAEEPPMGYSGIPLTVSLPAKRIQGVPDVSIRHRSPDGEEEMLQPREVQGRTGEKLFVIRNTKAAGIHELLQGDRLQIAFAVNVDPKESDLRRLKPEEARRWLEKQGFSLDRIQVLEQVQPLEARVLQARFGVELWKYFLLLAVFCAVVELILGREIAEEGGKTASH